MAKEPHQAERPRARGESNQPGEQPAPAVSEQQPAQDTPLSLWDTPLRPWGGVLSLLWAALENPNHFMGGHDQEETKRPTLPSGTGSCHPFPKGTGEPERGTEQVAGGLDTG